jgi:Domain of unknown function (DUF4258)
MVVDVSPGPLASLRSSMLVANIDVAAWGERMGVPTKKPKFERSELIGRVHDALQTGKYWILPHARQRCTERDVSATDIEVALEARRHVPRRDRFDVSAGDWSYCFEGPTLDGEPLRVIVAFAESMLIVTVVRLDDGEEF